MIICERMLTLDGDSAVVDIVVFGPEPAPVSHGPGFVCRFEIRWPDRVQKNYGLGIDRLEAILEAFTTAGTLIHTSTEHRDGRLVWLEPSIGYGLPVPRAIRDMLRGNDRQRFG